jgi:flagellar hook-length control protein FliK
MSEEPQKSLDAQLKIAPPSEEKPQMSLKAMADGLWINKSLEAQGVKLQFIQGSDLKLEATPMAYQMRTQLVDDMKPLLMQYMSQQKGGQMTLTLRPESLGLVRVDVQVSGQDVRVAMQAEQEGARKMLVEQSRDLREQLSASGLRVSHLSVEPLLTSSAQHQKSGDSGQWQDAQQRFARQQQEQSRKDDDQGRATFEDWMSTEGRTAA